MTALTSITHPLLVGAGVATPRYQTPAQLLSARPGADELGPDRLRRELGRGFRYKDQATKFGTLAAIRALTSAGLWAEGTLTVPGTTVGVIASSDFGNLTTVCESAATIRTAGVRASSAMELPNASSNVIASTVAIRCGLRGPNLMVCNGVPSGLDALRWAASLVASGRVPRVVVVGAESAGVSAAALVGCRTTDLFEGAAAVVVETRQAAAARGVDDSPVLSGARRLGVPAEAAPDADRVDLWLIDSHRNSLYDNGNGEAIDLGQHLGRAYGALGVLQCATAVAWLHEHGAGRVVAIAGNDQEGTAAISVESAPIVAEAPDADVVLSGSAGRVR